MKNITGLSVLLRGKQLDTNTTRLPDDLSVVRQLLQQKWSTTCERLNISMRSVGLDVEQGAVTSFMEASEDELSDMRKDDLLSMLAKIGRRLPSSLRKQQLVNKIISIQQAVLAGTDNLQEPKVLHEEGWMARDAKAVKQELLRASLSSWVMKPLVVTAGMKEGSINETEVLKVLPFFCCEHPVSRSRRK